MDKGERRTNVWTFFKRKLLYFRRIIFIGWRLPFLPPYILDVQTFSPRSISVRRRLEKGHERNSIVFGHLSRSLRETVEVTKKEARQTGLSKISLEKLWLKRHDLLQQFSFLKDC